MRLILVDATHSEKCLMAKGHIDPDEKGFFTLFLFKTGMEHLLLKLEPTRNALAANGNNCLNYVGTTKQPAALKIDKEMRSRDIKLTAIYTANPERHHIYLYATPMSVESEDLVRGVLMALHKKQPVPRDYPLIDITQIKIGKLELDYDSTPTPFSVFA